MLHRIPKFLEEIALVPKRELCMTIKIPFQKIATQQKPVDNVIHYAL